MNLKTLDEPISYKVTIIGVQPDFSGEETKTEILFDGSYEDVATFVATLIKNSVRFELTYEDNELVDKINEVMGDA